MKYTLGDRIAAAMLRSQDSSYARTGRELGIPKATVMHWFNLETHRAGAARYAAAHPDLGRASRARYAAAHPEVGRASRARYEARHREVRRAKHLEYMRRRAGWFEPDGMATQQEMEQFSERFNRI